MNLLKRRLARMEAKTLDGPYTVYRTFVVHDQDDAPEVVAALQAAERAKLGNLVEPYILVERAFVRPRTQVEAVVTDDA
jgi:hypothetical protein